MPSQIELLAQQHATKKSDMQNDNLTKLLAKYGGQKHMNVPMEVRVGNAAADLESKPVQKPSNGLVGLMTKFSEDVYSGKHGSVWGSFYDLVDRKWGYRCCHTFEKGVLDCAAEKGRLAYQKIKE